MPDAGQAVRGGHSRIKAAVLTKHDPPAHHPPAQSHTNRHAESTFLFRRTHDRVGYHDLNTKLALRKRKRGALEGESFLQPEKAGGMADWEGVSMREGWGRMADDAKASSLWQASSCIITTYQL